MYNRGFQYLEQRDTNDNIVSEGVVSKKSPFATADNMGIYDVIAEDLRVLHDILANSYNYEKVQEFYEKIKQVYVDITTSDKFGSLQAEDAALEAKAQAQVAIDKAQEAVNAASEAADARDAVSLMKDSVSTMMNAVQQLKLSCELSERNAKSYAQNAKSSEDNSKVSEDNAKESELNAKDSETLAKKWAEDVGSPDGEDDAESPTEKTQSSKTWAIESKAHATSTRQSEVNAKTSEDNAKTSELNAKSSETNSRQSELNAKESETNAKTSEENASDSEINSAASADMANKWAEGVEGDLPDTLDENENPVHHYSAKYYAEISMSKSEEASDYAANAHESELNASTSEANAKASENNTKQYATDAKNYNDNIQNLAQTISSNTDAARKWAEGADEDLPDTTDENDNVVHHYSAKHYAEASLANSQNAENSATNASLSETNAKSSETNAKSSEDLARAWAISTVSPDNSDDVDSETGKTQSSRSWALEAKNQAGIAKDNADTARALSDELSDLKAKVEGDTFWEDIKNKPTEFTPASHTHTWSDITDKPTEFASASHTHNWDEIQNKPNFSLADHTHTTVNGHTVEADVPANAEFTDTTYGDMTGASDSSDGVSGLVPSPTVADKDKFLKGDGTWGEVGSSIDGVKEASLVEYSGEKYYIQIKVNGSNNVHVAPLKLLRYSLMDKKTPIPLFPGYQYMWSIYPQTYQTMTVIPSEDSFDCSYINNTWSMFAQCLNLHTINLGCLSELKDGITSTERMFYNCNHLTSLTPLAVLKTYLVVSMEDMFSGCHNLGSLDLSSFKTHNVTTMRSMFYNCQTLSGLDLSSFETHRVIDMAYMFYGCKNLTSLDLSNFYTPKLVSCYDMFARCTNLVSIDIPNLDTSKVKEFVRMFELCSKLTTINGVLDMSSCTNYTDMFSGCTELSGVKIKNPPADFTTHDETTGLNAAGLRADQYEIVTDESSGSSGNSAVGYNIPVSDIGGNIWLDSGVYLGDSGAVILNIPSSDMGGNIWIE